MSTPILVFGVPRSGTTLVRTLLDSHSRIACGPETPWLAEHQPSSLLGLARFLREHPTGYCASYGMDREVVRRAARAFADHLLDAYARSKGKPRWAEKTPDNLLFIDSLLDLFPDARCLHVVRDPIDTAISTAIVADHRRGVSPMHERGIALAKGFGVPNTCLAALLRRLHWDRLIERGLRGRERHVVAYESLVRDPETVLRGVMDFLGEPFEPAMLDYARSTHDFPAWEWGSADVLAARTIRPDRVGRARELPPPERRVVESLLPTPGGPAPRPALALASVREIEDPAFVAFMRAVNSFAGALKLRVFENWSKVWEYPWLWFNGLAGRAAPGVRWIDVGSELSPIPWIAALLGAKVTLVERDPDHVALWTKLRDALRVDVEWAILPDERLPVPAESADIVTSFSVIEHQPEKPLAVREMARVLRPGGVLAISFDVHDPSLGTRYPAWNGSAISMREFERLVWECPELRPDRPSAWNVADVPAFLEWHQRSAPHHTYAVGAAVLTKRA